MDFANLEAQNNEERLRAEIAAQRKQVILKRKLEAVTQQMDGNESRWISISLLRAVVRFL